MNDSFYNVTIFNSSLISYDTPNSETINFNLLLISISIIFIVCYIFYKEVVR